MLAPVVPMTPVIERGRDVLNNPKNWAFRVMGRVPPDVADARVQDGDRGAAAPGAAGRAPRAES